MRRSLFLGFVFCLGLAAQKRPFDVQAMMRLARVIDPQISPDGSTVAYTVQTIDLETNKKPKQIYTAPVAGGALPRQLTRSGSNERARWTPDSKQIVYVSDQSGSSQVWIMNADGSGQRQITNLSTEANGVVVSPDGKNIVFTSDVYPECADDACNKRKLDEEKASKTKARVYTSLLYRHWNEWKG